MFVLIILQFRERMVAIFGKIHTVQGPERMTQMERILVETEPLILPYLGGEAGAVGGEPGPVGGEAGDVGGTGGRKGKATAKGKGKGKEPAVRRGRSQAARAQGKGKGKAI